MKGTRNRADAAIRMPRRSTARTLRRDFLDRTEGAPIEEITMGGLVDLIERRWKLIAVVFALTTLGAGLVTFWILAPVYQSTAMVLIKPGREFVDDSRAGGRDAMPDQMDGIVMAELEILHSEDLIRDAVGVLGPIRLYADLQFNAVPDPAQAAIARFREDFSAKAAPGTAVIRLSFRHSDPVLAAEAVNLLVDLFTQHHLRAFSQPLSTSFLEGKVAQHARDLQDAEKKLRSFLEEHPILTVESTVQELEEQRAQIEGTLNQARNDVAALKQQVEFLRGHQASLSRTATQREALDLQIVNADAELLAQTARQEGLERQLATVNADLQALPGYMERHRELLRERDAAEARHRLHSEQLERAVVSSEMDRANIANISIIQRGQVPPEPSYPRKLLNLAIGSVLGLGLGLAAAVFREGFAMRSATDLIEESHVDLGPRGGGVHEHQRHSTDAESPRSGPSLEGAQGAAAGLGPQEPCEVRHHQPASGASGAPWVEASLQAHPQEQWVDPTPQTWPRSESPAQRWNSGDGDDEAASQAPHRSLLGRLCKDLSKQDICWCHQRIEDAIEHLLSGPSGHQLFVRRTDAQRFIAVLQELGFKQVRRSSSRDRAGVVDYCGYDAQVDRLVWVSTDYHLGEGTRGHLGRRPANGRERGCVDLVSGGALIAIVGADGAGKSTAIEALDDWLSPHFRVVKIHMGKPRQSWSTLAVKVLLRIGGRIQSLFGGPRSMLTSGSSEEHVRFGSLVYRAVTARDRLRAYRRARRLAARGALVLCDRFPLPEIQSMDGRRGGRRSEAPRSWLARRAARLEARYYGAISRPDVLLVLSVRPDAALRRRPEDPEDRVRQRAREVLEIDWVAGDAHVVDAERSLNEVHRELKAWIWAQL